MRFRTLAAAALVLGFSLGCGSVGEQLLKATGAEMNVVSGADAKHPADFPLPPPAAGTIDSVISGSMAGMKMVTVTYLLGDGGPSDDELLAPYEQIVKAQGMDLQKSTQDGTVTVAGTRDNGKTTWSATITRSDSQKVLALVVIGAGGTAEAPPAEAPPAEQPAEAPGEADAPSDP